MWIHKYLHSYTHTYSDCRSSNLPSIQECWLTQERHTYVNKKRKITNAWLSHITSRPFHSNHSFCRNSSHTLPFLHVRLCVPVAWELKQVERPPASPQNSSSSSSSSSAKADCPPAGRKLSQRSSRLSARECLLALILDNHTLHTVPFLLGLNRCKILL